MKASHFAIFLMGPTASGKTDLAIQLASRLPVDIISVDSGMVYRGLDIGTAKPGSEEQEVAPHQLIDICDPAEPYSAARFRKDALAAIEKSFAQNRIPLLVGGTLLYFHVLKNGLSEMPQADMQIREKILREANQVGWRGLHAYLQSVDPYSAEKIHPNDPQRIQRALEVYFASGKTRTELWNQDQQGRQMSFEVIPIAISPSDRSTLHSRIAQRFYQMLEQGFLKEVETLFLRGDLYIDLPAVRLVGYRQAWQYLLGSISKEKMIESAVQATRQLAKRQLTWIRRWEGVQWLDSTEARLLDKVLGQVNSD